MTRNTGDKVVTKIVAAAPPPSEWAPGKLERLQRLAAPIYRAAAARRAAEDAETPQAEPGGFLTFRPRNGSPSTTPTSPGRNDHE